MSLGDSFARAENVSDRQDVVDRIAGHDFVSAVEMCGPGLLVIHEASHSCGRQINTFTGLIENHGWYVAAFRPDDNGDVVTVMPLPEVEQ